MPALRTLLGIIAAPPAAPTHPRVPRKMGLRWVAVPVAVGAAALAGLVGGALPAHGVESARPWRITVVGTPSAATTSGTEAGSVAVAAPASPDPGATPTAPSTPASVAVAIVRTEQTFTDTTRPTPARGAVPGLSTRTIRTVIFRPAQSSGPVPVVVFAHGYDATPELYLSLLESWADAGYLVVAPDSPGSAGDLPGAPTRDDLANQAQDLSFVLTEVLADPALRADPARVAAAGHSDGGTAVALLALDPASDPRLDAFLVLSGDTPDGAVRADVAAPRPTLAVVGDLDEYGNLSATTALYDNLGSNRTLIVARGGDHLGTYTDQSQLGDAVRSATVQFLDSSLTTGRGSISVDGNLLSARAQ
ncbi:MAG: hypothetical protein NVS3B21_32070 [Acidimicrobiales bacterium]